MALRAGGSAPNITAFVLPAPSCQSVRAALLRPTQVPGSYIASASQVLVSALVADMASARLRIVLDWLTTITVAG